MDAHWLHETPAAVLIQRLYCPTAKFWLPVAKKRLSTSSAELYDPSTGTWTPTGSMNTPRASHMATLITAGPLSGMVLVSGRQ